MHEWRWSWRNLKTKMDAKAEILSVCSQFQWRNSRINSEVCHGMFQVQYIFKIQDGNSYGAQLITLNTKMNTSFQSSREGKFWFSMDQPISSQGGLL
jgi:hypothetical protein